MSGIIEFIHELFSAKKREDKRRKRQRDQSTLRHIKEILEAYPKAFKQCEREGNPDLFVFSLIDQQVKISTFGESLVGKRYERLRSLTSQLSLEANTRVILGRSPDLYGQMVEEVQALFVQQ